ncbi:MAG: hypothetical protein PHH26_03865 [Candidatus Thermoplasmatota archaeon]|nr:hypothetical protein [Candidatus Thermoplasmatota archaeon]
MNFNTFWAKLAALEKKIQITSPVKLVVKNAYWGAPPQALSALPIIINALSETERTLGFGSRDQRLRLSVQLLAARATVEDERSSQIATAFWFAAKDVFDQDTTIGSTVSFSTLRGGEPTVPVILTHAGQAYIGFNAFLEMHDVEAFEF